MEDRLFFSNTAQVEIQGDRVLRFMDMHQDRAEYQVIGFDDPVITVLDYRPVGLKAVAHVLDTEDTNDFALQFNIPTHVTIGASGSSSIQIELRETDDPVPAHTLWIAIGIEDGVPVYDYVFERIVTLDDKRLAFLGLYRRNV